jgi:hypothetical protein
MTLICVVDDTDFLAYTAPSFLTAMILAKNENHATRAHHVKDERETCQHVMVAGADRTPVAECRGLSARDGATTELRERRDDYTSSPGDSIRASRRHFSRSSEIDSWRIVRLRLRCAALFQQREQSGRTPDISRSKSVTKRNKRAP